jgi:hypothetical protein
MSFRGLSDILVNLAGVPDAQDLTGAMGVWVAI